MTILDSIVAAKYREVEERKLLFPVSFLEKCRHFNATTRSLKRAILKEGSYGIIAEFKRKSPSAGLINEAALPFDVCLKYSEAGASAVSVLTDAEFFGGSSIDLSNVREHVDCPVLRKDFIIDEYQIIEARSIGADAILLIAEIHEAKKLKQLFEFACSLELEALIEFHDEKNISRLPYEAQMIGINSRNLDSFRVNIDHLAEMTNLLPSNVIKVAESGIKSVSDYHNLKAAGFSGFLIGEYFMKNPDPGSACKSFIGNMKNSIK